jgi:hypothetical protein
MNGMNAIVRMLFRDPLKVELAALLHTRVDPRRIAAYGLPAYKSYQLRRQSPIARCMCKFLSQRSRARLVQDPDYLRLGAFQETETYRFLAQLWQADLDWRRVDRYQEFRRLIESGEVLHLRSKRRRITTAADLDVYFEQYASLLRSMAQLGYVATGASDRITILIDRNGDILKETKGRHRLEAAQIVDTGFSVAAFGRSTDTSFRLKASPLPSDEWVVYLAVIILSYNAWAGPWSLTSAREADKPCTGLGGAILRCLLVAL